MLKSIRRVSAAAAAVIGLAGSSAGALTILDPTLQATTFSTAPTFSVAIPGGAAPGFAGFVYALSRSSGNINELAVFDASGAETSRSVIGIDAGVLQVGAGSFAGRLFVNDFGLPLSRPDGVYEVASDTSVSLFSSLGGGNPDGHGIAFGTGGSFGSDMYVANPTGGSNAAGANQAIVRVGTNGAILGTLASDANGPFYLAFPNSAVYGDYLYFTLLSSNVLMRVDAAGNVSPFATLGAGETAIDLAFGVGGALGNALYATVNNPAGVSSRRLVRILPDGSVETVGTGLSGFRFDIDPASGDLFLADEGGGILRISAVPEPGTLALLAACGAAAVLRSRVSVLRRNRPSGCRSH